MIRKPILCLLVILFACHDDETPNETNTVARLHIQQQEFLMADNNPIMLRGINWGWWGTALQQDASAAVAMHANIIRIPFRWYFTGASSDIRQTDAPGHIK